MKVDFNLKPLTDDVNSYHFVKGVQNNPKFLSYYKLTVNQAIECIKSNILSFLYINLSSLSDWEQLEERVLTSLYYQDKDLYNIEEKDLKYFYNLLNKRYTNIDQKLIDKHIYNFVKYYDNPVSYIQNLDIDELDDIHRSGFNFLSLDNGIITNLYEKYGKKLFKLINLNESKINELQQNKLLNLQNSLNSDDIKKYFSSAFIINNLIKPDSNLLPIIFEWYFKYLNDYHNYEEENQIANLIKHTYKDVYGDQRIIPYLYKLSNNSTDIIHVYLQFFNSIQNDDDYKDILYLEPESHNKTNLIYSYIQNYKDKLSLNLLKETIKVYSDNNSILNLCAYIYLAFHDCSMLNDCLKLPINEISYSQALYDDESMLQANIHTTEVFSIGYNNHENKLILYNNIQRKTYFLYVKYNGSFSFDANFIAFRVSLDDFLRLTKTQYYNEWYYYLGNDWITISNTEIKDRTNMSFDDIKIAIQDKKMKAKVKLKKSLKLDFKLVYRLNIDLDDIKHILDIEDIESDELDEYIHEIFDYSKLNKEQIKEIDEFKEQIKSSWYFVREIKKENKITDDEAKLLKMYSSSNSKVVLVSNNYFIEDYMNDPDENVRQEIGKKALYYDNTDILKNSLYYNEITSRIKNNPSNKLKTIVNRLRKLLEEFNESSESAVLIRIEEDNSNIKFGFYSFKNLMEHQGKRILYLTRMYNQTYGEDNSIYFEHDI